MKKTLLPLFAFLFFASILAAQSSTLVFRANSGGKFWLVVDDLRKNLDPETQVSVIGLEGYDHHVKVIFEKVSLGTLEADMHLNPATEVHILLRPSGPQIPATTEIVLLDNGKVAMAVEEIVLLNPMVSNPPGDIEPAITINENPVDPIHDHDHGHTDIDVDIHITPPADDPVIEEPAPIVYVDGYQGPIGCDIPMDASEYDQAINSIKSKSYDNTRVTLAKQITRANCLTVDQIKGIINTFTYEGNKLDYAKFAHPHTYDPGNYYKLNDAFGFSSSIDKLDEFLKSIEK